MAIAARENLGWLIPERRQSAEALARGNALDVLEALNQRGALFQQDIKILTKLLPTHLEEALRELAALGLVTCDSFAAVRKIVDDSGKRARARRPNATARSGRWSLFPGIVEEVSPEDYLHRWCLQLVARYGVIFRDLLHRETAAPSWGQLVPMLRRMERRGELRGGRFVKDVGGEQYGTEQAIYALRKLRDAAADDPWVAVSGADPLNLAGILTEDAKLPAIHSNTLIWQNGTLVATKRGGEIHFHQTVLPEDQLDLTRALHAGRRLPPQTIPIGFPRARPTAG